MAAFAASFSDERSEGNIKLLEDGKKVRLASHRPFATSIPLTVPIRHGRLFVRLRLAGNFCRRCAVGAARPNWHGWADYAGLEQEDLQGVSGGWGLCADGTTFIEGVKSTNTIGDFRGKDVCLEMDWHLRIMVVTVLGERPVVFTNIPQDAVPGVTIVGRRGRAVILCANDLQQEFAPPGLQLPLSITDECRKFTQTTWTRNVSCATTATSSEAWVQGDDELCREADLHESA